MSQVNIRSLTKYYSGFKAVDNINLEIESGELLTLLGPSGCGKTTILRCIAGLEAIDEGEISIGGSVVSSSHKLVPPERRNIGMIFQSYAIWPHLSVFENVAYGLRLRNLSNDDISRKVERALEFVGLEGLGIRNATQLSGGQQQRVAIARSIVTEPDVLLFDEPLSNVDAKLRNQMRSELRKLQKRLGITSIYVTHDQSEALAISDRIVLINRGKAVQEGAPSTIYDCPNSSFSATFIGTTNLITAKIFEKSNDVMNSVLTATGLMVDLILPQWTSDVDELLLSIRPENIKLYPTRPPEIVNVWSGRIINQVYMGSWTDVEVDINGLLVKAQVTSSETRKMSLCNGENVFCHIDPQDVVTLKN